MTELVQYADFLMATGSVIGLFVKGYALKDTKTTWSRRSSGLNVLSYPLTAHLPMFLLELYVTLFMSILTYLIWLGIYWFRAPEDEDWKGNLTLSDPFR